TQPLQETPAANALAPPLIATRGIQDTPTAVVSPTPWPTGTPAPTIPVTPTMTAPAVAPGGYPLPVDESRVEAILAQMTLEQKVGQMLMVGLPQATIDDVARRRITQQHIGGVILLEHNTQNAQQ